MQPLSRLSALNTGYFFFPFYHKRISTLRMDWLHSGTSVEYRELFDITGGTTSRIRAKAWMKTIFFFEFLLKNFKIILSFIFKMRSRSTLRAGRFGVWNPWRSRDLYLLQIVQTGCGTHPACYSIGIVVLSLRIKRPEREVNHSPSFSTEVKNQWSYTNIPPICIHGVGRENLMLLMVA